MAIKRATELLTEFLETELREWDDFPIEYIDVESYEKYVAVTVALDVHLYFRVEHKTGLISVQRGTDGDYHLLHETLSSC